LEVPKTIDFTETIEKILDVEKLKYCFECGICTASCSMADLLDGEYNPRELLEKIILDPKGVLSSEELWLCAWCYRCYKRCPQALKLPEVFLLMRTVAVRQGHTQPWERVLQKIAKNMPLPLVTAMVCFHPERVGLDRKTILEKIEQSRDECPKTKIRKKRKSSAKGKIAIIGSGPAGLTVASELGRKGYCVTIFESLPLAGGMLSKCIPDYRLPREVVAREIQFIKDLGVEIRTGVTIGKDTNFEGLRKEGYAAIFVGSGAQKSQKLKIEGGDLGGVVHALDFLWGVNSAQNSEIGKNIIVIGGGNVAIDAARTALKMGANSVTILYRRSREEMPANPWGVKEAEQDGVKIEFFVTPVKFLGEGKVSAIECARTQLGEPDETGRPRAVLIEGSSFKLETDSVILAIGEAPDLGFLPKDTELNEDGTLWVNPITMETSMPGVFAGGDVVTGPASVIEAIRAGKQAAESIEKYLKSSGGRTSGK
jgi:NADPH-dependent glutamate synthase beta subunit-like oxidoreductase